MLGGVFSSGLLKKALWQGRGEFERRGVLFQYVEVNKQLRMKSETFFSSLLARILHDGSSRKRVVAWRDGRVEQQRS